MHGMTRRFVRLLLAAGFAVTALAVTSAPPATAIVGGSVAPPGAYPFMASLQDGSGFAFCGGSVISSTWVLTAAHCVEGDDGSDLWVVTGREDLSNTSAGQRIKVASVHVHPAYANSTHDAALLRLASATSSPAIQLSTAANENLEAAGTPVKVTGWGDQLPTLGLFSSNQLREVDLEVVSDAECGQTNFGFDAATGVCAAELLKDSCQGDSGGPLFGTVGGTRIQIGIVSYGTSCALPRFPGVYSEVNNTAIRSWITSVSGV
jgi:secreted trypsin-like serine protease